MPRLAVTYSVNSHFGGIIMPEIDMKIDSDNKLDKAIKEASDLCDKLIKENMNLKIENINLKLRISILTGEEFKC